MDIAMIKKLLDACYQAKRARELLPALPDGVTASHIRFLDTIESLERQGIRVKVSDLSDALHIPRPGVTRTVKEMEEKGYLTKSASDVDGRITYLSITKDGAQLSRIFNEQVFAQLKPFFSEITEEDAACTVQTVAKIYSILSERRITIE